MYANLNSIKNTKGNEIQVNVIESALTDLKNKTRNMSKKEIEIEKPERIVNIVEKILNFNKRYHQEGKELKIVTPNQMLSRLPMTLAQLKERNNSEMT